MPVQPNRCTNGTVSVLKGPWLVPVLAADNVGHSGMYVSPPRMCKVHSVVAGWFTLVRQPAYTRGLYSAALHSIMCGDQGCNDADAGWFYNY